MDDAKIAKIRDAHSADVGSILMQFKAAIEAQKVKIDALQSEVDALKAGRAA